MKALQSCTFLFLFFSSIPWAYNKPALLERRTEVWTSEKCNEDGLNWLRSRSYSNSILASWFFSLTVCEKGPTMLNATINKGKHKSLTLTILQIGETQSPTMQACRYLRSYHQAAPALCLGPWQVRAWIQSPGHGSLQDWGSQVKSFGAMDHLV